MRKWKVLWKTEEGGKRFRIFKGEKPSEAVQFAKQLKKENLTPSVISVNKAFRPTAEQETKRRPGMVWCPYCLKWRNFKLFAIRRKTYTTDALMRCPVCTISTNDFYVRKYNDFLDHMDEAAVLKTLMKYEGTRG